MARVVGPALVAILEAIEGIETATCGKTIDDYKNEWLLRHGVQRGIEIISEAARRIPPELQATQLVGWVERQRNPSFRDAGKYSDGFRLRLNPSYLTTLLARHS